VSSYPQEALGSPRLSWPAIFYLCLAPFITVGAVIAHSMYQGFAWSDVFCLLLFYGLTVLAITAGYHRYYTHRSYECSRIVQFFYLVIGAASMENPVINWASNHRYHHQYEDTANDPYNIRKGFLWAHFFWMFYQDPKDRPFANVPDLKKDALVRWQQRNYWPLVVFGVVVLPGLVGAAFGRPLAGILWGGFLRMVVVQHVTFSINSVAHSFGRKTHSENATARDSHWLAVLSMGEGYHSYHHAYPADYRLGTRAHHIDPGKWWIAGLARLGLARKLRRYQPAATPPAAGLTA
jgi:stearoyl-CoA desaturase (Delta-9 desaturase)